MNLMPNYVTKRLPVFYATEQENDPMVIVKFFAPWLNWTWYAVEFDGTDRFYGYVVGFEAELGYFSLSELRGLKGPFGLGVERDLYFQAQPLSSVMKLHRA